MFGRKKKAGDAPSPRQPAPGTDGARPEPDPATAGRDRRAPDPEDPAKPDGLGDISKPSWKLVLKRTIGKFQRDGVTDLAAALTYYSVLSLFPAILALVSLLGVFGQGQSTTNALLDVVRQMGVAQGTLEPIQGYLENMQGAGGAGIALALGLAGALWAASNYVNAFSRAMNTIYETKEGRPIWKLRPVMLLITLVVLLLIALVGLSLVFTGPLAEAVGSVIGLGETAVTVWSIAKWPVLLLIVVGVIAILYYATPNVKLPKFRWMSPGAFVALLVWVLASAAFGFYVANFGSYNETYGALAGVIIFLLWLWLTNVALLFGAEFDAELERGRQLQAGIPAEHEVQLPPRDRRNLDKNAEKQEKVVEESRRIRLGARRGRRD